MSTITYPTELEQFTFTLPLPNPFHPNYLEYAQHVRTMAEHIEDMGEDEYPRIQLTGDYQTPEGSSYPRFMWSVALFKHEDGFNGSDFSVEDATHVYGGDYDVFPHTTLAQLRSYVSLYGRLVVTFDCEDTVRFLSQHSVMVAENMPTHQKKEGLLC